MRFALHHTLPGPLALLTCPCLRMQYKIDSPVADIQWVGEEKTVRRAATRECTACRRKFYGRHGVYLAHRQGQGQASPEGGGHTEVEGHQAAEVSDIHHCSKHVAI